MSFCEVPGPAVALDGYVVGASTWDGVGHASFDHHADCRRVATRATCEQVAFAIRARCPVLVDGNGQPQDRLAVYINDVDPDVGVSWWLLNHPELVDHPHAQRLVVMEGAIDCSGGTDVGIHPDHLEELAWLIEPWTNQRCATNGSTTALHQVLLDMETRIDAFVDGRADRCSLTGTLEVLDREGCCVIITESHPLARLRLGALHTGAFLSIRPGTPTHYTVGVTNPWIRVDFTAVYQELNALEAATGSDCWGGSDVVGGSPRISGSRLDAVTVANVINRHLR